MRSWSFKPHQRERPPECFTHRPPQLQSAGRPSGGRPLLHRGALSAQPGSRPDLSLASTRFPLRLRRFPRNWIHGFHRPSTLRPSCWLTSTCARRSTHPCPQEDSGAHIAPARRPRKTTTPPEGHVAIPHPECSTHRPAQLQSAGHPSGGQPLLHCDALSVQRPEHLADDLRGLKAPAVLRGDSPCSTAAPPAPCSLRAFCTECGTHKASRIASMSWKGQALQNSTDPASQAMHASAHPPSW
jgi:hypothetical protein